MALSGDHPRSRGVYPTVTASVEMRSGSSPLARGLRGRSARPVARERIIPARAGFTGRPGTRGPPDGDHPRSRGVYADSASSDTGHSGSSPLARGLPAGSYPASFSVKDHPRSRGVYLHVEDGRVGATMSGAGIIPARAGFTISVDLDGVCAEDHPRSRGVYGLAAAAAEQLGGSSPLARGLLFMVRISFLRGGIIPARAGFTHLSMYRQLAQKDHPRSRGVYNRMAESYYEDEGSSPLARGLRPTTSDPISPRGIIPARAGFTSVAFAHRGADEDHPRSRGVY